MIFRRLIFAFLYCMPFMQVCSQSPLCFNTGLILSKVTEGSEIDPHHWGRGSQTSFNFENSSIKPGVLIGISLKPDIDFFLLPMASFNLSFMQQKFTYKKCVSHPNDAEYTIADTNNKSLNLDIQTLLNIIFINLDNLNIYGILGPILSLNLYDQTEGNTFITISDPWETRTYTNSNIEISCAGSAFLHYRHNFGLGASLVAREIPVDIQLVYNPAITDSIKYPNLKTTGFQIILSFQLASNRNRD